MRRRIVTTVLTALFVIAAAVHVASYYCGWELYRMRQEAFEQYSLWHGRCAYLWFPSLGEVRPPYPPPPPWKFRRRAVPTDDQSFFGAAAGSFGTRADFRFAGLEIFWPILVVVPLWMTSTATFLPAAICWRRILRARRAKRRGLCPTCHYDLRATPGRCPECGAVPAANSITSGSINATSTLSR